MQSTFSSTGPAAHASRVTREGQVVLQIHADGKKLNIGIGQPLAQRLLSDPRTDIGALPILDPSAFLRRNRWSPPTRVNSGIADRRIQEGHTDSG